MGCRHERGVALIYVLFVFTLIMAVTSQIIMEQFIRTKSSQAVNNWIQAKHHAFGAEQYISLLLEQDFQDDKDSERQVDHYREKWHVRKLDYGISQGKVDIIVVDEQAYFNVNTVSKIEKEAVDASQKESEVPPQYKMAQTKDSLPEEKENNSEVALEIFKRLLNNQQLDETVAHVVQDWISEGQEASPQGAKDSVYLSLEPPRRISEVPMVSVSELSLVDSFDNQMLQSIVHLVTVLPQATKVNINTAPGQVLSALFEDFSEGEIQAILLGRKEKGISSLEELGQLTGLQNKLGSIKKVPIAFYSQFFGIYIISRYRGVKFYLRTLVYRNDQGQVEVVGRELGSCIDWVRAIRSLEF